MQLGKQEYPDTMPFDLLLLGNANQPIRECRSFSLLYRKEWE